MGKKIFILVSFTFLTLLGSLGFVFGSSLSFITDVRYAGATSTNVYLDTSHLSKTVLAFYSLGDISQAKLSSLCDINSRFVTSSKNLSFFEVDYSKDPDCKNGNLVIELDGKKIPQSLVKLDLKTNFSELSVFLDVTTTDLKSLSESLTSQQKKFAIYKNYKGQDLPRYFSFAQGQRKFLETTEQKNIIDRIISAREQTYISPVPGKNVVEEPNKIPNAGRPYRAAYTDGIHHGWDIDAPKGTPVVALDDGIILRVVKGFTSQDFSKIVYGENLSHEQKLQNLDILRGNQVWLKTMKGEVIFYSHLDSIDQNIQEGILIKRNDPIGTIGITGVPGSGYEDFHLHFEVKLNPFTSEKQGLYTSMDYMKWAWAGKGLTRDQVYILQKKIFQH